MVATPPDLTPDFLRALPDGTIDNAMYQQIEDALDKVNAPMMDGTRWLTLPERIIALAEKGPME